MISFIIITVSVRPSSGNHVVIAIRVVVDECDCREIGAIASGARRRLITRNWIGRGPRLERPGTIVPQEVGVQRDVQKAIAIHVTKLQRRVAGGPHTRIT